MTAEEIQREVREARGWLARATRHIHAVDVRNLAQSASGACFALQFHVEHPEAGVKVPETLADLRKCLAELRELVQRYPPPPTLVPEHLGTGELRPVTFVSQRRYAPRVISKSNIIAPRRGR